MSAYPAFHPEGPRFLRPANDGHTAVYVIWSYGSRPPLQELHLPPLSREPPSSNGRRASRQPASRVTASRSRRPNGPAVTGIIHLDQWADLDERATGATSYKVTGLSEDREAAHGSLCVGGSLGDRHRRVLGQWTFAVGPKQKPVFANDAVTLTPSRELLVDLLTARIVNRFHAACSLRLELPVRDLVRDGHARSSRRTAPLAAVACVQPWPPR